jgi:hypothetical protein
MLGLGDLLNNPLAKTVATAFAGPLAPIGMDLLSSATKGGFDPLQSLLQPFNSVFQQATSLLPTPFRSTPATFASPALGGSAGQLLASLGDVAGKKASALEKLKSTDPIQQQQGLLELQEIQRAIDLVTQVAEMENESKKKIISKIS